MNHAPPATHPYSPHATEAAIDWIFMDPKRLAAAVQLERVVGPSGDPAGLLLACWVTRHLYPDGFNGPQDRLLLDLLLTRVNWAQARSALSVTSHTVRGA